MAVSVTFQKRVPPGASRGTLAELMARQKAAADAASSAQGMETPTIMQGLGKLGMIGAEVFKERRAASQEGAARGDLAKMIAGLGPEGASQQQIADMGMISPEDARYYQEQALAARQRADELRIKQEDYKRDIAREDAVDARELGQTIAGEGRAAGRETVINTRELEEQKAEEIRKAEADRVARLETQDYQSAEAMKTRNAQKDAAYTEKLRKDADYLREQKDNQQRIITGPEAAALGGLADRQYQVSADGTKLTPLAVDDDEFFFEGATPEDYKTFNLQYEQPYKMKVNRRTGDREPISVGTVSPMATEVAGRVGLMKSFLEGFPDVMTSITKGELTGTSYPGAVGLGRGEGGRISGIIRSGSDALLRNLTGAGMPLQEAEKYVRRYEPTWTDDAVTLARKVTQLRTDMLAVREAVLQNRAWTEMISPEYLAKDLPITAPQGPGAVPPAAPAGAPAAAGAPAPAADPGAPAPALDPHTQELLKKYLRKR